MALDEVPQGHSPLAAPRGLWLGFSVGTPHLCMGYSPTYPWAAAWAGDTRLWGSDWAPGWGGGTALAEMSSSFT